MSPLTVCVVSLNVLVFTGCSSQPQTRAETQPGAAADLDRPPYAGAAQAECRDLPSAVTLRKWVRSAPGVEGEAGGLFSGQMEWAAIVNRQGEICATAVATDDPASAWAGSQAVAKAKAYTANAYSTDGAPLSTARLYTLTQPGHSLWGVAEANPFRADCLAPPKDGHSTDGRVCGGSIAFGGGVPLYRGKTRVGGLGVSGDTSCTDLKSPNASGISRNSIPRRANLPTTSFTSWRTGPHHTHTLCAPIPGGTDQRWETRPTAATDMVLTSESLEGRC